MNNELTIGELETVSGGDKIENKETTWCETKVAGHIWGYTVYEKTCDNGTSGGFIG
jgi:hypothetical protein